MSTSPDTSKGKNFSDQPLGGVLPNRSSRSPGLTLLKGVLWLALVVGLLVALAMNYEIVWDVLVNTVVPGVETILDVAEGALDGFFLLVGMSAAVAPMATAYTGFVLALAVVYLLSRKTIRVYRNIQAHKQEVGQVYSTAWNEWYGAMKATTKEKWTNWWNSLDLMNKVVAIVFMVLIGIPLALLLSFILGSLVANLF